jgi:UDP-N-acetylglucosamine 2-epimerase (non-hydrolysing)
MKEVAVVIGTRPEAIKMAPVVLELRGSGMCNVTVISTGQHVDLLDGVLEIFGLKADVSLEVMTHGQSLGELTSRVLIKMENLLSEKYFDLVVVHGDTTTAMATSLACFFKGLPVAHVEAGLRTRNLAAPFPEEMNRQVIARVSELNFATSNLSSENLRFEGIHQSKIYITGNTVVDSVRYVYENYLSNQEWVAETNAQMSRTLPGFSDYPKIVLVTLHRRENSGEKFANVLRSIRKLSIANSDTLFVFPVHPNPIIKAVAGEYLSSSPNVILCEPLSYTHLLLVLEKSRLAISDSGGIQEEGLTLRTPILVARDDTERPEGLGPGRLELVGANSELIFERAQDLLRNKVQKPEGLNLEMNPYGDGSSGARISKIIHAFLERT